MPPEALQKVPITWHSDVCPYYPIIGGMRHRGLSLLRRRQPMSPAFGRHCVQPSQLSCREGCIKQAVERAMTGEAAVRTSPPGLPLISSGRRRSGMPVPDRHRLQNAAEHAEGRVPGVVEVLQSRHRAENRVLQSQSQKRRFALNVAIHLRKKLTGALPPEEVAQRACDIPCNCSRLIVPNRIAARILRLGIAAPFVLVAEE